MTKDELQGLVEPYFVLNTIIKELSDELKL